jgi:hypothetical protein
MVESLVGETRTIVGRLAAAFAGPHPAAGALHPHEPHGEVRASRMRPGGGGSAAPPAAVATVARSDDMAEALAAAVERLRARADEPAPDGMRDPAVADPTVTADGGEDSSLAVEATPPSPPPVRPPLPEPSPPGRAARPPSMRLSAPERPPVPDPAARQAPSARVPEPAAHKHSLSWIGRWRIRRKQRRGR